MMRRLTAFDRLPRASNWRRIGGLAALLGLAIVALHVAAVAGKAESDDEAAGAISVPSRASVKNGMTFVTLDAAARQNAGIETAPLAAAPGRETVTAFGTVLDAARLTELRNSYLGASMHVQTVQAKLAVARAAFARAKTLNAYDQAVSVAVMQSAQGDFEVDQATLAAARSTLATTAANAEQTFGPVLGKALVDGAPLIENLIARRLYLVKVTLPPGAAAADPPATASVEFASAGEAPLAFISLGTSTDPRLQGKSYFYSVAAASGLLPGMNVVVPLPAPTVAGGVTVPASAVLWLQGQAWVYLQSGTDTFVRRQIAPDRPASGGGYIVRNLPPTARIVIRGAQMLLSEEFRAQMTTGGDQD